MLKIQLSQEKHFKIHLDIKQFFILMIFQNISVFTVFFYQINAIGEHKLRTYIFFSKTLKKKSYYKHLDPKL